MPSRSGRRRRDCLLDVAYMGSRKVGCADLPRQATTHELMAISGHKTLTEVQRYTDDADRKRLAESGMAKRQGQTVNTTLSNPAVQSVKPGAK